MKKKQIALGTVLLIAVFICGISCGYFLFKFSNVSVSQASSVQSSENTTYSLTVPSEESETAVITTTITEQSTLTDNGWPADGYNYLAIGNSITKHNITSYWWNEIGMAASDEDHDYFHVVLKYLEKNNENVNGLACNLYGWESQSQDRDGALYLLDGYLSPNLDLITIQLGENVDDLSTFQSDFLSLLLYIKDNAPNARILVVGDFWNRENRNELKETAAKEANVEFVSLKGITGNKAYYRGLGSWVYDSEGNLHEIEHEGVAIHPGDAGMKAIADRIIDTLAE